jgi:cold shock CspA family protein
MNASVDCGFIEPDDGRQDILVHVAAVARAGLSP